MADYRKKPVVIQAQQWFRNGDHPEVQPHGYGQYDPMSIVTCQGCGQDMFIKDSIGGMGRMTFTHGEVKTLESAAGSAHIVCPGDWIIRGVKGEHYACKPDIFAATYEPA